MTIFCLPTWWKRGNLHCSHDTAGRYRASVVQGRTPPHLIIINKVYAQTWTVFDVRWRYDSRRTVACLCHLPAHRATRVKVKAEIEELKPLLVIIVNLL